LGVEIDPVWAVMDEDPDDYRPASSWALAVDPERRTRMSLIRERIGVGDRIPRHWHDIDEVVLYESGHGVAHLDGTDHDVRAGSTAFIPAGAIHGTVNTGEVPLEIRAIYPATSVRMNLIERNPAPGTEADPPQASTYDMATGEFVVHGPTALRSANDG
jgi:quercetin dioxygenase-like cupin family protein